MKSIKLKLLLIFSTIILLVSVGIEGFAITAIRSHLLQDADAHLIDLAKQEAKHIQSRVDGQLAYISALAQNPILSDEASTYEEKSAFFEAEAKRAGYLAFGFADKNGNATRFNNKGATENIASEDYFQSALNGQAAFSDVIVSSTSQELILCYATPVYKSGEMIGVFYGIYNGNTLSNIVSEVNYKQTGYTYIINNQGVTVGHKNIDLVIAKDNDIENMKTDESLRELGELTQKMISGDVGSGEYTYNGITKMAGFAPINNSPWIVIFGIEKDEVLSSVNALQNTLMIVAIVAVILGALITYFISNGIANPIKRVTQAAQGIAQGNLDVTLSVKSKDEVGHLAEAFNLTVVRLANYQGYIDEISQALSHIAQGDLTVTLQREYVGQFAKVKDNLEALLDGLSATLLHIYQASEQVNSGAEQVANSAQALSQGATEQAMSIEELSAVINEATGQINMNYENSKTARDKAALAGGEMYKSTEQMSNMIAAMAQITTKSSEISKIIKIIDDIAFQTNILALNAAVEAARAGSAGRGFAVVADEVRNLAAKSAEAAKNTTVLIEETLKAVESGSQIAGKTADSLNISAKGAKEVIALIDEIALSSDAQATGILQINQSIEQISSVVQTNAATAEQSAAASEELSSQANALQSLITKFQLRQNDALQYSDQGIF